MIENQVNVWNAFHFEAAAKLSNDLILYQYKYNLQLIIYGKSQHDGNEIAIWIETIDHFLKYVK